MPRPCQRACLESGIKLDLNRLVRRGFIQPGAYKGSGISWTNNYTGEQIASGFITADMSAADQGWFNISIGELNHRCCRTAERYDELPPVHSITSSARNKIEVGTVSPSARAAIRLTASSNFVGC